MKSDDNTRSALEEAIYREIGAHNLYGAISSKIVNPHGKEKFRNIAEDEQRHREKLESWYRELFHQPFRASREKIKDSEIGNVQLNRKAGAEEALDIAMDAEMRANEFYSTQAEKVENEDLKELYLTLAEEEEGHYNLLLAEKNALAGGFYWFDMDSTAFMED